MTRLETATIIDYLNMISLSYHLSKDIQENIRIIESLRSKILLTPLKPKLEQKLKWEANIEKTYWGLTLADNPLTKVQIAKLLSKPIPKKLKNEEKEVVNYMNTLKLIQDLWTGTIHPLNTKAVLNIYDLSCKEVFGSTTSYYKSKEDEVRKILQFIESGKDHPVIKAGLIQIEITKLSPFENATGRVARLLSHLMLSRFGYDLRGLLVLEDFYRSDLVSHKEALGSIEKYKNATKWLEYFTKAVKSGMEKSLKNVSVSEHNTSVINKLWRITDRQKKIMDYLDNPNLKITNKEVQKMFNISKITASRDLSKMANMGILLQYGKGRSVYYTR